MRRAQHVNQGVGYHAGSASAAFTLVEMLLSLTIASLLVASIASTVQTVLSARQGVDRRTQRVFEARHAMDTVVAALRNVRRDPIPDVPLVVGYSGGHDIGNDKINLQVISNRRVRSEGAESDQYEMSFYLADLPDRATRALMCRTDHALDEYWDNGGIATTVADGVIALSFEYYDGEEWLHEWSEFQQSTPKAVRVTLAVTDAQPQAGETQRRPAAMPDCIVLSTVVPIHVTRAQSGPPEPPDHTSSGGGESR